MMEKFEEDSSTPISHSYDSRARFIKNAEAKQHGISQEQVIVMHIDMEEAKIERSNLPL